MHARGLPSIIVMAVLSCIAIGCGIYAIFSTSQQMLAVVVALSCVALGQLFLALTGWANTSSLQDAVEELFHGQRAADKKYTETFVQADLFETEIADLKRRATRAEKDVQDVKVASRDHFNQLSGRYEAVSANTPFHLEPALPAAAPPQEHLNFLLQPVIDLTTNETAHYRARFNMSAANGSEIDFEKLVANADRGGLRASLDVHVITQAIPLLRRLRAKNPGLKMFIPIGVGILSSVSSLAMATRVLADASDVANGIVFELSHDALGKLNETGISGLATIARMGATLALSDASVAGLDLASLRQLGVKFIGINSSSIDAGYGIASTWHEFAQVARGLQFQIMLTDIGNAAQAATAAQIARLVTGPYFAPPRRVKFNAGLANRSGFSAAA